MNLSLIHCRVQNGNDLCGKNGQLTFQFQGGIQTVKMVFFDRVDLGYESGNLKMYNPEKQGAKQLKIKKKTTQQNSYLLTILVNNTTTVHSAGVPSMPYKCISCSNYLLLSDGHPEGLRGFV